VFGWPPSPFIPTMALNADQSYFIGFVMEAALWGPSTRLQSVQAIDDQSMQEPISLFSVWEYTTAITRLNGGLLAEYCLAQWLHCLSWAPPTSPSFSDTCS